MLSLAPALASLLGTPGLWIVPVPGPGQARPGTSFPSEALVQLLPPPLQLPC